MRSVIKWHGIFGFNTNGSQTPIKYTLPLNIVYNGCWLEIQPAIKLQDRIDVFFVVNRQPMNVIITMIHISMAFI